MQNTRVIGGNSTSFSNRFKLLEKEKIKLNILEQTLVSNYKCGKISFAKFCSEKAKIDQLYFKIAKKHQVLKIQEAKKADNVRKEKVADLSKGKSFDTIISGLEKHKPLYSSLIVLVMLLMVGELFLANGGFEGDNFILPVTNFFHSGSSNTITGAAQAESGLIDSQAAGSGTMINTFVLPVINSLVLNSTFGTNLSKENLTVYINVTDADNDSIKSITNWYLNGSSITVLNMPFENGSSNSTFAKDYSSFGNHGINNGAIMNSTGGHDGFGAYDFDGSSSYLEVNDSDSLDLVGEQMSWSVWIQPDFTQTGSSSGYIFDKSATNVNAYRVFFQAGADDFRFRMLNPSVNCDFQKKTWSVDDWIHMVGTYDGSNMRIYWNGVLDNTCSRSGPVVATTQNLRIGFSSNGYASHHFDGVIDELMIFNKTLSAEEVLALYHNRTDLIVSAETAIGDNWSAEVIPNDGFGDGVSVFSNNLTIIPEIPYPPVINSALLNSTGSNNLTSDNVTATVNATDANSDDIKLAYNWKVNGNSILYSYYTFDKENYTNVSNTHDYSNHGFDGVEVGGVTWLETSGFDGKGAYDFDGSSGYINSSYQLDMSESGHGVTFVAWVYPDTISSSDVFSASGSGGKKWRVFPATNWKVSLGGGTTSKNTGFSVDANEWQHLAAVWDPISEEVRFYKNGNSSYFSFDFTGASSYGGSSGNFTIGKKFDTANFFNGKLDEVMIFNRSLTTEQIQLLYENRSDEIAFSETSSGDIWSYEVTANDGNSRSNTTSSNNSVTITNTPAYVYSSSLNLTGPKVNTSSENFSVSFSLNDSDGHSTNSILRWFRDGNPQTLLYLPFNYRVNDTRGSYHDYSGNNVNVYDQYVHLVSNGRSGEGAMFGFHDIYGGYLLTDLNIDQSNTSNGITMMAWALASPNNQNDAFVVIDSSNLAAGSNKWSIFRDRNSASDDKWCYTTGTAERNCVFNVSLNTWQHLAASYDVKNSLIRFYVDGVNVHNTTSIGFESVGSLDTNITVGTDNSPGASDTFLGAIDDVIIFDGALSSDQIEQIYNEGYGGKIYSSTTNPGENWTVEIVPNDGYEDGIVSSQTVLLYQEPNMSESNLTLTTDLTSLDEVLIRNVSNFTWVDLNKTGKIIWYDYLNSGNGLNLLNETKWHGDGSLNDNIEMGQSFASVNGTSFAGKYAEFSIDNVESIYCNAEEIIYTSGFYETLTEIQANGESCGTRCINITAENPGGVGTCRFVALTSTGYAPAGGNSNLTINDSAEGGNVVANTSADFYAYYVNRTSGEPITPSQGGYCNVSFDDGTGPFIMSFNGTGDNSYNYTKASGFASIGIYNWNVTCGATLFTKKSANDTIDVINVTSNNPPGAPVLLSTINGVHITNRTPTFIWNNSIDLDGDNLTYGFLLDDNPLFNLPEMNITDINETATNTSQEATLELDVDTTYYWKVRAFDGTEYGNYSQVYNFTVDSYIAISLIRNTISFGSLNNGDNVSTNKSGTPQPFLAENIGNIPVNISINATPFFSTATFPSDSYQFRIEVNESGAFNTTQSLTNWTNMSGVQQLSVINLDWHIFKNDFLTGMLIRVPNEEGAGTKTTSVTFSVD